MRLRTTGLFAIMALTAAACFHPAIARHNTEPEKNDVPAPYDLVWDATIAVIKNNELKVQAQDPVHGIIEAQGRHFTLKDADCGLVSTPLGKTPAEPTEAATAVYNFYLKPDGPEATNVTVQATFSTPGNAPFHPTGDIECVSKGRQEARLLQDIKDVATHERRPVFKPTQS